MSERDKWGDKPEDVENLKAMTAAVRAAMAVGWDIEQFLGGAKLVWNGVLEVDQEDELSKH